MRRNSVGAWAVVCLATAACGVPGPSGSVGAGASCAGPSVEVEPRQAQPGDRVSLRGEGHVDGCDDTGESQPAVVLQDLPVVFRQGTSSRVLDRVDPTAPGGVVRTTVTVPVDARPGPAEITVGAAAALVEVGPADVSRAAVRPAPADGTYEEALATGVLRADPATGCLWLEDPDGAPTVQLLLQGDSYRVDLAAAPPAVLDGDTVVARTGDRIEVGGGFSDRETGVAGCPVQPPVFVGHSPARPARHPRPARSARLTGPRAPRGTRRGRAGSSWR